MRPHRIIAAFTILALVAVAACTGSSGHTQPTPVSTPSTATVTPTTPETTSTTPAATTQRPKSAPRTSGPPKATVPVDQIPPGNPRQWVPAGVPTYARYREPGDTVPMFNRGMFVNGPDGAKLTVVYFIAAENWAIATAYDPNAFEIVCTSSVCKQLGRQARAATAHKFHTIGTRTALGSTISAVRATPGMHADWIVEVTVKTGPGRVLRANGSVVTTVPAFTIHDALYLAWTGRMWKIVDDRIVT